MRTAFTLVELLVVIAIIVVLLALLAPAMDRAMYQAELATCATREKGTCSSLVIYASDFKRRYPYRYPDDKPNKIYIGSPQAAAGAGGPSNYDGRKPLSRYMSINRLLNDPLAPAKVDFEQSKAQTRIEVSYQLWYTRHYHVNGTVEKGVYKMGDRMTWFDGATRHQFDFLVSDVDDIDVTDSWAIAGHPDEEGIMEPLVAQDSGVQGLQYTLAAWFQEHGKKPMRGPIDVNYGSEDGSVRRYGRVPWDAADKTPANMVRAPVWPDGKTATQWELHLGL